MIETNERHHIFYTNTISYSMFGLDYPEIFYEITRINDIFSLKYTNVFFKSRFS